MNRQPPRSSSTRRRDDGDHADGLSGDVRRINAGVELMGTSIAMIDRHYGHSHGHLASDSRDRAVARLDALRARQHRQRSTRAS